MAFAGGLLAGLAGLAEAPGAYQSARRKSQEIEGGDIDLQNARDEALSKAAQGLALKNILSQGQQIAGGDGGGIPPMAVPQSYGGGGQGGDPTVPPGVSSQQPQAPPQLPPGGPPPGMVNPRQMDGQLQNLTGGNIPPGGTNNQMTPPHPGMMMPIPARMPPGMSPQQPGGMAPQPRPSMPSGPPGGSPSGAHQQPGAGPPGGGAMPQGMPRPQLGLRQIIQAVVQNNPNAKPEVIARAVNGMLPIMNAQAQQEWHQMSQVLRQQGINIQQERVDMQSAHNKATEEHQRETLQLKRENMERLAGQYQQTLDAKRQFQQSQLDMQLQRLQQGDRRLDLAQIHSEIDAAHKRAMEEIQSFSINNNMDPKLKESIMKSQFEFYKEQIGKLEAASKSPAKGGATGPRTEAAGSGQTAQAGEVREYQGKKYKFKGGDQYAQNNWQEVSTA